MGLQLGESLQRLPGGGDGPADRPDELDFPFLAVGSGVR